MEEDRGGTSGTGRVTRYFYFWCQRCPTRVAITTEAREPEVEGAAMPPQPEACPMCGYDVLASDDDLVARGEVVQTVATPAYAVESNRLVAWDAAMHAALLAGKKVS